MEYTTQMDAARKGIITKEMEIAAKKENMDVKELMEYMAKGQVIIPCNKLHTSIEPNAIGSMLKTKINVNLGISRDWKDMDMEIQKTICKGAPFYVLGPLVTDIAPGYDHITAAIGGAIAAASGASFLCYVTPAEHLRLPSLDDVKEGIIASRIAAHAADIAKGVKGAIEWDHQMSLARKKLDWEEMFDICIDPEKARRYRAEAKPEKEDTCSMCGNFCAVKNMNRILDGEIVNIYDE